MIHASLSERWCSRLTIRVWTPPASDHVMRGGQISLLAPGTDTFAIDVHAVQRREGSQGVGAGGALT